MKASAAACHVIYFVIGGKRQSTSAELVVQPGLLWMRNISTMCFTMLIKIVNMIDSDKETR